MTTRIPTRCRWGTDLTTLIVGNNTRDDAPALQRAINCLPEGSTIDLTGKTLKLLAQVTIARRVHLSGGTINTAGRRALLVTAADVTLTDVTVTRTGMNAVGDNGSAVTWNATNGELSGCTLSSSVGPGLHVQNGNCAGLTVDGGSYTTSFENGDNAAGIYVQEGATQNEGLTFDGATLRNTGYGHGIAIFNSSNCTVRNCDVDAIRRHPLIEVDGTWTNTTGNVWRVPLGDVRDDGIDPNVLYVNGLEIDHYAADPTSTEPPANTFTRQAADGHLYLNIAGDPNESTVTTTRTSGYGILFYATSTADSLVANKIEDNTVNDTDNTGIYLQASNDEPVDNEISGNTLTDVCVEGITVRLLPAGAIACFGGDDTIMTGNIIDGAGSDGKPVRGGIAFKRGEDTGTATATLTDCQVSNIVGPGLALTAGEFTLTDCTITDCSDAAIRNVNPENDTSITLALTGCTVEDITLDPGATSQTYTYSAEDSTTGTVTIPE